jgi:hypothetical protein
MATRHQRLNTSVIYGKSMMGSEVEKSWNIFLSDWNLLFRESNDKGEELQLRFQTFSM